MMILMQNFAKLNFVYHLWWHFALTNANGDKFCSVFNDELNLNYIFKFKGSMELSGFQVIKCHSDRR